MFRPKYVIHNIVMAGPVPAMTPPPLGCVGYGSVDAWKQVRA